MIQHTNETGRRLGAIVLTLFDGAADAHRLPRESRRLLQLAAAAYCAARQSGGGRHDRIARDLVLSAPAPALTPDRQGLVAAAVALQRERPRRQREPAFLRLGAGDQALALRLSAVLHLAAALEDAQVASIRAEAIGQQTVLLVDSDDGELLARLDRAAGRWRKAIGEIRVASGAPSLPEDGGLPAEEYADAAPNLDLPAGPLPTQLRGDEPLAEGTRRMLRHLFDKLLAREDGVREGEDPEDVHQMRVAARKLRASLQIVEQIYDPQLLAKFRRQLRRVARALGTLRDADVFAADVRDYRAALPPERQASTEPLLAAIEQQRARGRAAVLEVFEGARYARFKQEFARFLTTPGADIVAEPVAGHAPRVRDMAGSLIWRRYEQWRAYEMALPDAGDELLHEARIVGKQLRYALEFFDEALGPRVDGVLAPLVALQETLGHLQDGVAARASVAALGILDDPGAQAYLAARSANHAETLAKLPSVWDKVDSATYRRKLFELIAKL